MADSESRRMGPIMLHGGEPWVVISREQVRRALAAEPKSAARVYLAIRGAMGGAGEWFVRGGMPEIGRMAGVSDATARRCMAGLCDVGLLLRKSRTNRAGGDAPPSYELRSPRPCDPLFVRPEESTGGGDLGPKNLHPLGPEENDTGGGVDSSGPKVDQDHGDQDQPTEDQRASARETSTVTREDLIAIATEARRREANVDTQARHRNHLVRLAELADGMADGAPSREMVDAYADGREVPDDVGPDAVCDALTTIHAYRPDVIRAAVVATIGRRLTAHSEPISRGGGGAAWADLVVGALEVAS